MLSNNQNNQPLIVFLKVLVRNLIYKPDIQKGIAKVPRIFERFQFRCNIYLYETLLGFEIIDEKDTVTDMQQYARERWEKRKAKYDYIENSKE